MSEILKHGRYTLTWPNGSILRGCERRTYTPGWNGFQSGIEWYVFQGVQFMKKKLEAHHVKIEPEDKMDSSTAAVEAKIPPPHRVQRKRSRNWKMPENTVYVGRPSKWGNPFVVHGDGANMTPWMAATSFKHLLRTEKGWFPQPLPWPKGKVPKVMTTIAEVKAELKGKNLACWCPLDQPCHADVLLKIANSKE